MILKTSTGIVPKIQKMFKFRQVKGGWEILTNNIFFIVILDNLEINRSAPSSIPTRMS